MPSFEHVVTEARASWLANYTVGDERGRLRQLHGLYHLVLNNREAIVSALANDHSVSAILFEKEVAILVREIQNHITKIKQKSENKLCRAHDKIVVEERPRGVSLIISNSQNFLRFALAPLAASIAANNVVILATVVGPENALISHLRREWSEYLSSETVFFIPGISTTEIKVDQIDHVAVFDTSPAKYSTLLSCPQAEFYSLATGYNIAIVDEGKKDWDATAEQISNASLSNVLSFDRLTAVIISTENALEFCKTLVDRYPMHEVAVNDKMSQLPDCTPWGKNIFCFDTILEQDSRRDIDLSLERQMCLTQAAGGLLVIPVTSLDKALSLLNSLTNPIKQMTLIAPGRKHTAAYVCKWVDASIFCLGSINTVLPPIFDNCAFQAPEESMYSTLLFSKPQIICRNPFINLPAQISAIRAAYEKIIPPLEPEPRGERTGFFKQVEFVIKAVGLTAVIVMGTGLYFGVKGFRRRFL